MINEEIRDPQVRLIGENGDQLGIVDVRAAQKMADDKELDLVKIALGQFDLGKAAAMSIVYTLIVLTVSWVFYTAIVARDSREA